MARIHPVREFAMAILHGDPVHQVWLLEAAEAFIAGKPMPPPRSAPTPNPTPEEAMK